MRRHDKGKRHTGGFTVIELMVVMTIAVILMAVGLPSFVNFTRDYRASSLMSTLTADIQFGRSEAVKRNSRMLFCARASAGSTSCTGTPSTTAWTNGWLLCIDRDSDSTCDLPTAADPNPVRVHGETTAPLAISGPAATLILFPVGSVSAGATFTVTGSTSTTRTATIAASGSVTTAKTHGGY